MTLFSKAYLNCYRHIFQLATGEQWQMPLELSYPFAPDSNYLAHLLFHATSGK
jgi:hypothetical protein